LGIDFAGGGIKCNYKEIMLDEYGYALLKRLLFAVDVATTDDVLLRQILEASLSQEQKEEIQEMENIRKANL